MYNLFLANLEFLKHQPNDDILTDQFKSRRAMDKINHSRSMSHGDIDSEDEQHSENARLKIESETVATITKTLQSNRK